MPRPERIQYENAFYHVMNRGREIIIVADLLRGNFGFLANRCRAANLHDIRAKIQECGKATTVGKLCKEKPVVPNLPASQCRCPKCRQGNLLTGYEISPKWKVRRC